MNRRGAYAAGIFTLTAFLLPALFAPGPYELANIAGIALAIWMAVEASRMYRREDVPATLPYRIDPVGPGIIASAAIIFLCGITIAWLQADGTPVPADRVIDSILTEAWDFPFSPPKMFAMPIAGLPTPSPMSIALVTSLLTVAMIAGLVVSVLALVGGVSNRNTLRRHALIWRGITMETAATRLAKRGARGLRPISDPLSNLTRTPVSGRLLLRSFSMLIAMICLPYAPVFMRMLQGSRIPQIEAFFISPLVSNPFFAMWLPALWAIIVAVAMILVISYLRLAFALRKGAPGL